MRDPEHSPNPALKFWAGLRGLPPRFKRYLGAVGIFGAGDFSHSLLILAATQLLTGSLGVGAAAGADVRERRRSATGVRTFSRAIRLRRGWSGRP